MMNRDHQLATDATSISDGSRSVNINTNRKDNLENNESASVHKHPKLCKNEFEENKPLAPFSVFTSNEKYLIVLLCCLLAFWAAISGPIFFPALPVIREQFNVGEELLNIAVVMYFLLQGLAPMVSCSLSDKYGRRPVIIASGVIYIAANIGLARCQSFGVLLFLRCLQSAGISPMFPVSSALIGDVVERHERGRYVGLQAGVPLIGIAIGGLVGGLLVKRYGWRGIFWFLAIGAGVSVIVVVTLLPETKRSIVGDGSVEVKAFYHKSLLWKIPRFRRKLVDHRLETINNEPKIGIWQRKKNEAPKLFVKREVFMVLIPTSIFYSTWNMLLTTLTNSLSSEYHYSVFKIGLCYLAPGIGGIISSVVCGRIIDWVYAKYKKNLDQKIQEYAMLIEEEKSAAAGSGAPEYNAFRARLPTSLPFAAICSCGFLIFGWCIGTKQPLVAVLIGIFVGTSCVTPFVTIPVALFVDLYPLKAATSVACINLGRCLAAAVGIAALDKMESSLTVGGSYLLMIGLGCVSLIPFCMVIVYGKKWHNENNSA